MILEARLYNLREKADTLIALGRMLINPTIGSEWHVVMNGLNDPGYMHYRAILREFDTIPDGWVTARVTLVINSDLYVEAPISWWEHPTDIPTGIVRWLPYGNEGTHLLTLRADS